jgi:hypothetical protein
LVSVVDDLDAISRLMNVQAAVKGVTKAQTACLETALLHGHSGLIVRTQVRAAQQG